MIIKEFQGHRIVPLQAHSCPMWEFADGGDSMHLHISGLMYHKQDRALGALLGPYPKDLPQATSPLYACDNVEGMVAEMPAFDE
ncbi:hypothetical protein D1007_17517 [Hordeum vulgare]|nr:hypothetical protein D1007_17517 [Hordeum vulgare]